METVTINIERYDSLLADSNELKKLIQIINKKKKFVVRAYVQAGAWPIEQSVSVSPWDSEAEEMTKVLSEAQTSRDYWEKKYHESDRKPDYSFKARIKFLFTGQTTWLG